jgi:hypothetical protein
VIKIQDAEQMDAVKPVEEHHLCLAGAGFVNLLQQIRLRISQDPRYQLQPVFPSASSVHPVH